MEATTHFLPLKPGPNEDESCREFRLSLSFGLELSCAQSATLIDLCPLSSNLNMLNFLGESTRVFVRLAQALIVEATLIRVNSLQLSISFDPGLMLTVIRFSMIQ